MKQHEQNIETDIELLQIRQLDDLGWPILQLVDRHLRTRSSGSTTQDTPSTNRERRQLAQTADLLRQRRQLVVAQLRSSSVQATTWLCITHVQYRQIRQQLDLARQARQLVANQLQSMVNRGEKERIPRRTHSVFKLVSSQISAGTLVSLPFNCATQTRQSGRKKDGNGDSR